MQTPARTALRFGLYVGLGLIAYQLIVQLLKLYNNSVAAWGSTIFLIIGLVFAMQDFKRNNEGYLSYGEGLSIGTMTSGVAGLLSAIFSFVYISFIDNSFIQDVLNKARIELEKQGNLSDAEIDKAIEITSFMFKPGALFVIGIISTIITGFIISLIIAAIVKKNRPAFD